MKSVKEIMSHPVICVDLEATVQDAAKLMAEHKIGSVSVTEKEQLVGIMTERDLSHKVVAGNQDSSVVKVKEVMHSPVVTANPDISIFEASSMIVKGNFRRLPIVENGQLVGIVTETDIEIALWEQTINELKTKINELEVFNKMAIGRELKMSELKKRIGELEGKKR